MKRPLKIAVMLALKYTGIFLLSRMLTKDRLRILCYHGFNILDEQDFRPKLFISGKVFSRRLKYLADGGFPVLPLSEALERRRDGSLPPWATVLTIDDGFYSVYRCAHPILRRFGLPSTLYVSSYYVEKGTPIYNLAVDYICWKAPGRTADLADFGIPALDRMGRVELTPETRRRIKDVVIEFGEAELDDPGRAAMAAKLGERLGVDYREIARSRSLSLLNFEELRALHADGMDIQLHTHRHDFPVDPVRAREEIERNRAVVEPVIGKTMRHFCYPSGVWSTDHWPVLEEAGVASATTCEAGLVDGATPALALNRILDSAALSQVEFEYEMSGCGELVRGARRVAG